MSRATGSDRLFSRLHEAPNGAYRELTLSVFALVRVLGWFGEGDRG